jgi:2-phospho-L-lactate guanylyltransferase
VPLSPDRCAAVVPIRSWASGKSRLGLDDLERESVARAFALDVLDVLFASPSIDLIVVVTADPDVRTDLDRCTVVSDRGRGLNDAVAQGCAHAIAEGCTRVAVVPSDLPSLTVQALESVLSLAAGHTHAFCPDAEGDGTTIVVSGDPLSLVTSYGIGSAAAHRSAGVEPLAAPAEARRDVDTVVHLREAEGLGVGPRTAAALARISARLTRRP